MISPEHIKLGLGALHDFVFKRNMSPAEAVKWLKDPQVKQMVKGYGYDLDQLVAWFKGLNPMQLSAILAQHAPNLRSQEFLNYLVLLLQEVKKT